MTSIRFTSEDDRVIRTAIAQRKMIRFWMGGGFRVAEPHDYGVRKGIPTLLVWQVFGASRSGKLPEWRWVHLTKASQFTMLDQSFTGPRDENQQHSDWDEVWIRVESA